MTEEMRREELNQKKKDRRWFMGWQCPVCDHTFSPSISTCFFCPVDPTSQPKERENGKSKHRRSRSVFEIDRSSDFDIQHRDESDRDSAPLPGSG